MNDKDGVWWRSPIRILRRGAIGILGAYFFVNGLAKGGITLLVLALFLGDKWITRHLWVSIAFAFVVGGGIIFPLMFLMKKEDAAGRKVRWFFD